MLVIATDMDGTLLSDSKEMPRNMPKLLQDLKKLGITFVIGSGRSRIALERLFGDMAKELTFICDNGACVLSPNESPMLTCLTKDVISKALDLCKSIPDTMPVLCGYDHIYYPENSQLDQVSEVGRYYTSFRVLPYEELYQVEEPILKIALCNMHGTQELVYPVMEQAFGQTLELLVSGHCWMDIMMAGVNKGAALQRLCAKKNIPMEQVMTFGDYDNDISMLECTPNSYAMENAPDRVKARASHIAPPNTENGVVQVICQTLGLHAEDYI